MRQKHGAVVKIAKEADRDVFLRGIMRDRGSFNEQKGKILDVKEFRETNLPIRMEKKSCGSFCSQSGII